MEVELVQSDNNKCEEERSKSGSLEAAAGSIQNGAGQEDVICDGKYVVVERGDQQRIILFNSNQIISFGKGQTQQDILLAGASGSSFLSAFKASPAPPEVVSNYNKNSNDAGKKNQGNGGRHWKKRGGNNSSNSRKNLFILEKSLEPVGKIINEFYQLPDSISSGTDNRNIVDDNTSQAMKKQDIVSLREQGVSSKEILDTIITSSKSFSQKTEFAQEKYLKKKEKIYGEILMFHKPSVSFLADYYYRRDSSKILGLRADTVSQILSYANIHANGKYLVFENANGLVVSAVLRRLGGYGTVLHCHIGSNPSRVGMVCMNFTENDLKPMKNLDMLYLLRGEIKSNNLNEKLSTDTTNSTEEPEEPLAKKQKLEQEVDAAEEQIEIQTSTLEGDIAAANKILRHINTKEDNERSLTVLNETEFDGLIICAKEHPLTIFQQLVKRIAPSTPFVIFCVYPEPLMDCYVWAKENGVGCNVLMVDNWFRNIQVETERTHPEINMSSTGGYLLYGTVTDNSRPV